MNVLLNTVVNLIPPTQGADVSAALVWLRKKGMAVAGDKSGRAAAQVQLTSFDALRL